VKLWDLSTQHCVQTIVAHRAEVWSLGLNLEQDLLLTGSNEGELKAWRIESDAQMDGAKEPENGEVCPSFEGVGFALILPLTALESDSSYIDAPARISPSRLSDRISPHTSLSFYPIP
jgi:U3 small nucleolar RNA-associated protein 12